MNISITAGKVLMCIHSKQLYLSNTLVTLKVGEGEKPGYDVVCSLTTFPIMQSWNNLFTNFPCKSNTFQKVWPPLLVPFHPQSFFQLV